MSKTVADLPPESLGTEGKTMERRDFLYLATGSAAVIAAGAVVWPLIDNMNPSAAIRALANVDVDLKDVPLGGRITVQWAQKPIFIDHRTPKLIAWARSDDHTPMLDPALDSARAQRPEWLIQIGICTHLGCIPLGQKADDPRGDWGGWYCPCHGSVYDAAGRIRKGPAPRNLDLPPYKFISDTKIRIG